MTLLRFGAAPLWLAFPVMIALGVGGGYVAAEMSFTDASPPATATAHSDSHGAAAGDEGLATSGAAAGTGHSGHETAVEPTPEAGGHAGHEGTRESAPPAGGHSGHGATQESAPPAGEHDDHDAAAGDGPVSRPRAVVLTTFGAANAAILIGALVLRRRAPGRRAGRTAPQTTHTA